MAARLKKRALAEYQSQVEIEEDEAEKIKEKKTLKKLKLSMPGGQNEAPKRTRSTSSSTTSTTISSRRLSTTTTTTTTLDNSSVIENLLETIVYLSPAILDGTLDISEATELAKKCSNSLGKCCDLENGGGGGKSRSQLYLALDNIIKSFNASQVPIANEICEDWLGNLISETSNKAKSALLSLLANWLQSPGRSMSSRCQAKLLNQIKLELTNQNHLVKVSALKVLGQGTHVLSAQDRSLASGIMAMIGRYTKSQDPRVRKAAFEALLDIHRNGHKLDSGTYKDLCEALSDDYEGVRMAGLKLVHVMAQSYPEEEVLETTSASEDTSNNASLRLVDDAFGKICNAVQDLSVQVRELSITLIGSLDKVSW